MSLNTLELPDYFTFTVGSVDKMVDGDKWAIAITLVQDDLEALSLANQTIEFIETEDTVTGGVAIDKYGAIVINSSTTNDAEVKLAGMLDGVKYETYSKVDLESVAVGDTITLISEDYEPS